MGVLEQVTQMRGQGKSDEEIISDLRRQRVSPREINEALNQAQIKNAVSDAQGGNDQSQSGGQPPSPSSPYPGQAPEYSQQEYPPQDQYGQGDQSGGYPQQDPGNYPQGPQDQQYNSQNQQQGYYDQQYQGGYDAYGGQPPQSNNDTMVEISEQVFEEKSREMSKKIDSFDEFKTLSQTKLDHLNERLKRIESVMDRLQAAILERIGSYGKDLGSIKKEMSMMQDTFAKTMEPLAEKVSKSSAKKASEKKSSEKK